MIVGQSLESALGFDFLKHVLERANDRHVAINARQILDGKPVEFIRHGFAVSIDRNWGKGDFAFAAYVLGTDHQGFGHRNTFVAGLTLQYQDNIEKRAKSSQNENKRK